MTDLSNRNFGLLIACIVPGFVCLWGLGFVSGDVRNWLLGFDGSGPNVGGFLYVTIASIGAGMVCGVFRWLIIDAVHHTSGLIRPRLDDRLLHDRLPAFERLVEDHYRYYQCYGNSMIALVFAYALWRSSLPDPWAGPAWIDGSITVVAVGLFAGSRDALARYYARLELLIGLDEGDAMTNGSHPKAESVKPKTSGEAEKPKPKDKAPQPAGKPGQRTS